MTRVLLAEDDASISEPLSRALRREGYDVDVTADGPATLDRALGEGVDLILLDIGLPELDGLEVCRRVRASGYTVPVLILTARADEVDTVVGLDAGADDYVTKPFSPRELMARVQAAIRRRRRPAAAMTYRFAGCELDFQKMTARRGEVPIPLTSHEFRLLKFFTEHAERVLSREELLNEVWGYNCYPTTRTVDNQILKLRQKLEPDPSNPRHLLTIYGAGYKFVP
jgi:DNA-binding response OmpR family regulator